jgi:uncharacterized protein YbaP (TraB family)
MKAILAALLLAVPLAAPAGAQSIADADGAIVQAYEPDPAVWLLQDDDTRIFLLGTVHVLPEGFRWRSARIDAIVAAADELILESTDDENPTADPQIARLLRSMAKRPGVSERLSPENGPKWLALAESAGIDPATFDRLPPLLALLGMGITASQQESGAERRYGVETVLQADFDAAGKPIGSIESATEVFLSLLALDEAVLIKELDRELSRIGGKDPATMLFAAPGKSSDPASAKLTVEHRWAQGLDVDLGSEAFGATSFGRSMDKALLARRNRAWAVWLERRLGEPGTILVAVGAGHLWGRNSVQALLAQRGLAAERVD